MQVCLRDSHTVEDVHAALRYGELLGLTPEETAYLLIKKACETKLSVSSVIYSVQEDLAEE